MSLYLGGVFYVVLGMRGGNETVMRRAGNDIGAAGATSLASALKESSTLTIVDLGGVLHVLVVTRVCAPLPML